MSEEVFGSPGDLHQPRDALSRAFRQAKSLKRLLDSDEWRGAVGVSSGLRSYALRLCDVITSMVAESESADAEKFDVLLSVVTTVAAELTGVAYELLEL